MRTEITSKYLARRGWATFIDYTFFWILFFFYIYVAGNRNDSGSYEIHGWPAMVPVLAWFLYFVVTENTLGGTPGHRLMGLKVRSLDNESVSFGRTLLRRLADILEINWSFGFIAWLIARNTPNNQRLGDLLAKTCVTGEMETGSDFEFDFEKSPGSI